MGTDRPIGGPKGKARSGQEGDKAPARRILLAGDKPFFVALRQRLLRSGELKVLATTTGAEALRAALANLPDAIFLHAELKDLDGFEVCRRLRDDPLTEAIPVVLLTDSPKPQSNQASHETSAVATVPMSIDPERLLNIIQTVLTTPLTRRSAPRVTVALNVAYRVAERAGTAKTLNLSVGGMFIVTGNPPEAGTHLALRFVLPEFGPVEAFARVAWVRHPAEEHPYPSGMVVQFLELPPGSRSAIAAFVTSLLAASAPSGKE